MPVYGTTHYCVPWQRNVQWRALPKLAADADIRPKARMDAYGDAFCVSDAQRVQARKWSGQTRLHQTHT